MGRPIDTCESCGFNPWREVVHLSKSKSPEFLSAYKKLKLLVVNNRFRPGEQLQACNLADRVVAGITPVREALIRLAAEDLISCYPKRGYFAKVINSDELGELYYLAHALLRSILLRGDGRCCVTIAKPDATRTGTHSHRDPTALVLALEQLHEQIAIMYGGAEAAKVIRSYNFRTHAVRKIYVDQTQTFESVSDYVRTLVALLEADERDTVVSKLTQHFEAKVAQVHMLVKEVTAQAFSRQQGDYRLETIAEMAKPLLGPPVFFTEQA